MVTFNFYFVLILGFIVNRNINAMETCAINNMPKCAADDITCVKTILMPWLQQWMRHGQDAYLVKPLDTITLKHITVSTEYGDYQLTGVKLTGFADALLTDLSFDLSKGNIDYSYAFRLDLVADHFVDENGKSLNEKPLNVHLDNLKTHTATQVAMHTRCNREQHVEYLKTGVAVDDINDGDVVFKQGMEKPQIEIIQCLAKAVAEAAAMTLAENFRNIDIIFPVSKFLYERK